MYHQKFCLTQFHNLVSSTHALSAAHCRFGRIVSQLALLIGEHDTSRGNETTYTVLIKIAEFINHPSYNQNSNENDIALIRTQNSMTFTKGVQAACLPFKYRQEPFIGKSVQALGWFEKHLLPK